jgi:AcrR family transcriptional regulator
MKPTVGLEDNRPTVGLPWAEVADLRLEKGRATRDRLIEAGRELFGEHGYEGTSIEAILRAAGVARGALYHHFDTKEALYDAVLDRVVAEIAAAAAEAARATEDPVESLQAGCVTWLEMALDPAVQRIALLDAPAVVGWTRWRELDEQHVLGGLRASLHRLAAEGRLPEEQVAPLAHMVLAAVNEAALMIARADDQRAALESGQAAVDTLIERLVGEPVSPPATSARRRTRSGPRRTPGPR